MEFEPFTLITACKVKQHVFLFDKPLFFAYSNDQILFYHVSFAQSDSAHTHQSIVYVCTLYLTYMTTILIILLSNTNIFRKTVIHLRLTTTLFLILP